MEDQKPQQKKDLIDPATATAAGLFVASSAAKGLIGFGAVKLFRWLWAKLFGKKES